jgi:hypothetical protein
MVLIRQHGDDPICHLAGLTALLLLLDLEQILALSAHSRTVTGCKFVLHMMSYYQQLCIVNNRHAVYTFATACGPLPSTAKPRSA